MVYDMELGREPYWMTLTGMNGCGKTMLMSQVYEQSLHINPGNPWNNPIWPPDYATNGAHRYEGGRPYCRFVDEQSLARRMRAGEFTLPASYREDYFVAFDELGVARDPTNFIADAVSTFCDGRLRGWGMFTTNLTLAEIADRMDPRIASRLIRDGNQVVIIKAGDYALRPAATLSKATVKLDEGDRQTFA